MLAPRDHPTAYRLTLGYLPVTWETTSDMSPKNEAE